MRPIRNIMTTLIIVVLSTTMAFAQGNPYGETYRNDKPSNSRSRPHRHCTNSYSNKLFNRDYAGLGNSNMYHIANELQSYIKYKCLTAEQIRRLAVLLQTDRDKYDFLVYAFNYVFDIENFAMTGSVLANRNAREGFYRFLVKEGIPAGDYYNDYYANTGYFVPPPVYAQPRQNSSYDNSYNNYPDPRYNNQTPQYGNGYTRNDNDFTPNNNNPNNSYAQNNNGYTRNDNAYPDINSKGLNSGYRGLMTYQEFGNMKERIKQNTLENGKLETAKAMTHENVLTAIQVAEITRLFTFDNNRLEYAQFAFDYTYDRENYLIVSDALAFQKNREALLRYVQQKK
jgi:Domain of unknown function (DUF4476)